jgi:GH43 family beta-xylosidase
MAMRFICSGGIRASGRWNFVETLHLANFLKMIFSFSLFVLLVFLLSRESSTSHKLVSGKSSNAGATAPFVDSDGSGSATRSTFTNPLLPTGPDPWMISEKGVYYYTNTTGVNITLWKTKSPVDLKTAEKEIVWTPSPGKPYSHELWAPELHHLNGKWYVYFAADDGRNQSHRIWVIENSASDPLRGKWTLRGKVSDPSNKWTIDASVFEDAGRLYLIWSGWEGNEDGRQDIYIGRLKNPWTVEGRRVRISSPQYLWERIGDINLDHSGSTRHVDVNEGPEILEHGDRIFLIYSASGCWTDAYKLGMLTATAGSDLLKASSWKKSPEPVFQGSADNRVYAPGHNGFFKSPDGKQDWILYHANPEPGQGCGSQRSPRAQPFVWDSDGRPNFGTPVALTTALPRPSGDY